MTLLKMQTMSTLPAGIAQLVERWALGHEVLGSNLPQAVPEVTLAVTLVVASPYQGVKLGPGRDPEVHYAQEQSAGND